MSGITLDHLWLLLPLFVMIVKGLRVPLPLLDFWWHLKMGEIIVSSRSIPNTDLFSFTAAGRPFVVQNWLAEVLYYKWYQLGGLPLLIFLNAILLGTALLPVVLLCREATPRTKVASISALLACLALACNARPQVFSLVFFAFFYWVLDGYRFQRRDHLWLLPLSMILWVNLHGAFVIGLGLIAIFLGSESALRLFDRTPGNLPRKGHLRKLGLVFVSCIAATLLNPETYKVYAYVGVVLSDQASQKLVMEWQPPRVDTLLGIQMFFGLFSLAILGLIFACRRPNFTDLLLLLVFSIFGLTALRNTAWFAVIIAPILARYLAELDLRSPLGSLGWLRFDARIKTGAKPPYRFNFALVVIAVVILVVSSPWISPTIYDASLLEPETPVKAVDYIDRHELDGRIFHPQIFGDYLIWRLYPRQRSFIDGRVHLFRESFVREYQNIFCDSHWEEKLASFDIQFLLLSKAGGQTDSRTMIAKAKASGNWTVLFEDDISILLRRNI